MSKNGKKTKAGFVYILENPEMPGMIKIGESINAEKRAEDLSKPSGVVGAYTVAWKHSIEDDNQAVEKALHYKFREFAVNKEFFRIDKKLAIKTASKFMKHIVPLSNSEMEQYQTIKNSKKKEVPLELIIEAKEILWEDVISKNKHSFIKDAIKMCLQEQRSGQPLYNRISALRGAGFTNIGRIDMYVLKEHLRFVVTTNAIPYAKTKIVSEIGDQVQMKNWEGGVSFFIKNKDEYKSLKKWLELGKHPHFKRVALL